MAFEIPTIVELRAQGRADVAAKLGKGPLNPKSYLGAVVDVGAGHAFGNHEHIAAIARNVPPREESESDALDEWGELISVPRDQPTFATGDVLFTGTLSAVVPAGTVLVRPDGARFATLADVTIGGGPTAGSVQAEIGGTDGNTTAGTVLAFESPIPGVTSSATVDTGLTEGHPIQSDAAYLAEIRDHFADRPHGGQAKDYVKWAKEVPGVTRVFVQPLHLGLGTVGVVILADEDPGGPIPQPSLVTAVQELLDDGDHAPVGVDVTVYAPAAVDLDPQIELIGVDTPAVRAAVQANLEDLLRAGLRADGTPVNAPGKTVPLSMIREAISTAPGEDDHDLASPVADIVLTSGQILVLGTITWI